MSSDIYNEIRKTLEGKWKVDRSENFEEFLEEVGVNILFRKMASFFRPTISVTVLGIDKVCTAVNAGLFTQEETFRIGEEFETLQIKEKMKAVATWEDGKLINNITPLEPHQKAQKIIRERVGDELLVVRTDSC